MSDIDWSAIRNDYEAGKSSLSALEREYGVSRQAIKKRANREGWVTPATEVTVTGNIQTVINRDVNAAVRVIEAIKYRQSGWTYDRIASQCGYANPGAARNAVQRELDRVIVQDVGDWRKDHTSRLEKMHETLWPMVVSSNPSDKKHKPSLFAVDRLVAIAEREAKLLGLDAKSEDEQGPQVIIEEVPSGYLGGPTS